MSKRRKARRGTRSRVAATNTQVNRATEAPDEATAQRVPVGDKELEAIGISLSDEQEAAADKVQEKYRSQLPPLNRDIQGFHTRLVSLEADKLVEIEKVLTRNSWSRLRAHRQERSGGSQAGPQCREQSVELKSGSRRGSAA